MVVANDEPMDCLIRILFSYTGVDHGIGRGELNRNALGPCAPVGPHIFTYLSIHYARERQQHADE